MKKITTIVLFLTFTITPLFSQISVTSNSLKSWLGFQQVIEADTSGNVPVNVGSAGANQMWDFSGLQGNSYKAIYEMFTASSTPYVADFPTANYAFRISFQSDLFNGMIYQYVSLESDKLRSLGSVMLSDGSVIQMDKDNDVTPLPITYGMTWETTMADTFEIPGISSTITTNTDKYTVDAWGTIKLPSGQYNCLRWKVESTSEQVMIVAGMEIPLGSSTYIEYTWIGENSLMLATVTSHDDETNPNFTTASGITWLSSTNGSTAVANASNEAPDSFELLRNYPNPFNPSTTISFQLKNAEDVTLAIYDADGRLVKQLAVAQFDAGAHQVTWNGTDDQGAPVAGGIYFCKLSTESNNLVRKMTLLK